MTDDLRIERVLPGPIEDVWSYLTDPENVRTWLANDVALDPRVGGEVTLHLEDGRTVKGTVTRCEPPRLLAYTWDEEQVSFELASRGDDVVLVLTHRRRIGSTGTVEARAAA